VHELRSPGRGLGLPCAAAGVEVVLDRAMDPIDTLLNDSDPRKRGRAHLTLGRQALDGGRTRIAARHFGEALRLMPTDPEALAASRLARVSTPAPPRRGWLRSWLRS